MIPNMIPFIEEQLREKDKEIERLNKEVQQHKEIEKIVIDCQNELTERIEKAIVFLKENACIDEDVGYFCDDLRYDDCKKLLNILEGEDKE